MSFAAFTVFTIYGALTHRDNRWITYGSIVLGLAFIPVAAYHAWRVQNVAKIEAEERLLTNAPIVSLELKISSTHAAFVVSCGNNRDAANVKIDPVPTDHYRLESHVLPSLSQGTHQPLPASLIGIDGSRYLEADLWAVLNDACLGFQCSLKTVLRYSNLWGGCFKRSISIDSDRLSLAERRVPDVINGRIERDRDAEAALG